MLFEEDCAILFIIIKLLLTNKKIKLTIQMQRGYKGTKFHLSQTGYNGINTHVHHNTLIFIYVGIVGLALV